MSILVVNAGSSSVKFTCFGDTPDKVLATGLVERIGLPDTQLHYRGRGPAQHETVAIKDHGQAVAELAARLVGREGGVLESLAQVKAVGHRVVHGGENLTRPAVVDAWVKDEIGRAAALAPLHNVHHLAGIAAAEAVFPHAVQFGFFDTAFHSTIPPHAFLYALPWEYYRDHKIRRYGFHGISHQYVSRQAARHLGRPLEGLRLISCHLGNGCSVTAIKDGRSLDTSMGLTPLEGLVMGTRTGDMDPAVVVHLMERLGLDLTEVKAILNKKGGMLALGGIGSGDLRDIEAACQRGEERPCLALEVFCHRIKKYVGAYLAVLGGVTA